MTKFEEWKQKRGELEGAERWAAQLGAQSRATARHVGTIHAAEGTFTLHYQPSDGASNYHSSPVAFNECLRQVMLNDGAALIEKTLGLMRKRERDAFISCRAELVTLLDEIDELESAAQNEWRR